MKVDKLESEWAKHGQRALKAHAEWGKSEAKMILWLTGQSGAGKTALAKRLQEDWPCIILDGDEMRDSISVGAGFSPEERAEHNFRVARLAKELSKQTNVVVSVIAPLNDVRKAISRDIDLTWVYIKRTLPEREGHFYEEPECVLTLDHDELDIEQSYNRLRRRLNIAEKKQYSLFIGRWQPLHDGHLALFNEVRKEGKCIAIGIRDTEITEDNPYSSQQRIKMIKEKVPDAKIFVMPDIEEVVYGRRAGWGVREICLDKNTEEISATAIRKEM